jgi:hypothetical protein
MQIPALREALTRQAQELDGAPAAGRLVARARKPDRHAMNKNEARYSQHLAALRQSGAIAAWTWSPFKVRLGSDWKTTITPDFMVVCNDGAIELVDCKGRKGAGFWAEEDALVKLKCAAEQYPWFTWVIVWQQKNGEWARRAL